MVSIFRFSPLLCGVYPHVFFAVISVGKICRKLDMLLVKILQKCPKVAFRNSMSLLAKDFFDFSSVFCVIFLLRILMLPFLMMFHQISRFEQVYGRRSIGVWQWWWK